MMPQIIIRKATIDDSFDIARFAMLAMEEIVYAFIGKEDSSAAFDFMYRLICSEGNQYSYNHAWVVEQDSKVVGAAIVYNGADLYQLRKPVGEVVHQLYGLSFEPEDETQAGEYYIDCIGIESEFQGKGMGSRLLNHLINIYVFKEGLPLGLLVDKDNPDAKRLYLKAGFVDVGEKTLTGKEMTHMQFLPK